MEAEVQEGDCDIYSQIDRLEQSLDQELNELELLLRVPEIHAENDDDVDSNSVINCDDKSYSNQTCIIKTTTTREVGSGETATTREAFYRCGSVCYQGELELDLQQIFDISLDNIPLILSKLQQQKNEFKSYQCDSDNVLPESNSFKIPLHELEKAQSFVASELSSAGIANDIKNLSWAKSDDDDVYFELVGDTSRLFPDILLACSTVHHDGRAFIYIYFEGVILTAIVNSDKCCILNDLNVSNFTGCSYGSTLAMYSGNSWMKLSMFKANQRKTDKSPTPPPLLLTSDGSYVQSYIILKATGNKRKEREVMFRFGSWCYSGKVDLQTHNIYLQDVPGLIREVRLAQPNLNFVGDVSTLSETNRFFKPMQRMTRILPKYLEEEAASCEDYLRQILDEEVSENDYFFEFACDNESMAFNDLEAVELVCNKIYNGNGVIAISIYHSGNWYLKFEDGSSENPLLDSKFPDLSKKRNGIQLKTYQVGCGSWTGLRSLSLWQVASLPTVGEKIVSIDGVYLESNTVTKNQHKKRSSLRSLLPLRRKNR
jgi:hypothetical protein